jgi:hypothetical protein
MATSRTAVVRGASELRRATPESHRHRPYPLPLPESRRVASRPEGERGTAASPGPQGGAGVAASPG